MQNFNGINLARNVGHEYLYHVTAIVTNMDVLILLAIFIYVYIMCIKQNCMSNPMKLFLCLLEKKYKIWQVLVIANILSLKVIYIEILQIISQGYVNKVVISKLELCIVIGVLIYLLKVEFITLSRDSKSP